MSERKTSTNRMTEEPSVSTPCSICGWPIFGSVIGTGDGTMKDGGSFAHPVCYWRDAAETMHKALKSITMWSMNGRQLCFRSANSVPMAMMPRLERIAKAAIRKLP